MQASLVDVPVQAGKFAAPRLISRTEVMPKMPSSKANTAMANGMASLFGAPSCRAVTLNQVPRPIVVSAGLVGNVLVRPKNRYSRPDVQGCKLKVWKLGKLKEVS